jgi:hypothetical protein
MTGEEMFEVWTPREGQWSPWVKPVLFAQRIIHGAPPTGDAPWSDVNLSWAPAPNEKCALVVDLPGIRSLSVGIALAARGYRPVPLFNACNGPESVVPMEAILATLGPATAFLQQLQLPVDAPSAFLLDGLRQTEVAPALPGRFDNRWLTFPQDFPSARFLLSHGVRAALLVREGSMKPMDDLAHVLLRWQEAGLKLSSVDVSVAAPPQSLVVQPPSQFRSIWYRVLAILGLRWNSAGGFGSVIPESSAG